KGVAALRTDRGEVHPLPNVELATSLVQSPRDRPAPAGFGAYDLTWPQRFSKIGTYDDEWFRTRFPGIAKDMHPTFFNVAPEDQWIEGYFGSDEVFSIENMHLQNRKIEGTLPKLSVRAFINQRVPDGEALREIRTRIDTVYFFPNALRGVLVYRGMAEV